MSLPPWLRRNRVFRFLASLHLALILLAVLILASIVGTLYESRLTAEVARAYIYEAWWFDIWLLFLVLNLAAVAFSRLPWKKSHTGFLLTHLGIITLLFGAYIGKTFGIEGSVTLFKGQKPASQLLINQKELRLSLDNGAITRLPASVLNRVPTEKRPLPVGKFQGWEVQAVGFSENLEAVFKPEPASSTDTHPALHFKLQTTLMGQSMERWLWLGDEKHSVLDLGLARIRLLSGEAPRVKAGPAKSSSKTIAAKPAPADVLENIFIFAKLPDQQINKVIRGTSSSLKIQLKENAGLLQLDASLGDKKWKLEAPASEVPRSWPLTGTRLTLQLKEYWPDFQLQDNKPVSVSSQPLNPAVLVEISGQSIPSSGTSVSTPSSNPHQQTGMAPALPQPGAESPNRLDVYVASDGSLTYHLFSRKQGESRGKLDSNTPLSTGWADWTFRVDHFLPKAEGHTVFQPAASPGDDSADSHNLTPGLLVRLRKGSSTLEEWVPQGWMIQSASAEGLFRLSYGWKTVSLPFAMELTGFEVQRYPGSGNPSEFRSTLSILNAEGATATGSCSMNQPMNYPDDWWRGWTGLTYKMSQASWNPENLDQSSIQILRDPGWLFKWTGSLIICLGIFSLFYLRPMKNDLRPPPKI